MTAADAQPLLKVERLAIGFADAEGKVTSITDDVSFAIRPGEAYGLVGESGCGKTVTCLSLLRLLPSPGGRVLGGHVRFKGADILALTPLELRRLRGCEIAMIFQEPGAALNPLQRVGRQLLEGFRYHKYRGDPGKRIRDLLARVGFPDPDRILGLYPHELSGGMLQRVMIAMALALSPSLLIADEPTTALDVTVQAQIMELLDELRREYGMALLMVTHNLNLIAQYADRLGVMYAGRLVEEATVADFLRRPLHPYSRGLLDALPRLDEPGHKPRPIPGQVPKPQDFDPGCRFRPRCPHAFAPCPRKPDLLPAWGGVGGVGGVGGEGGAKVACFLYPGCRRPGEEGPDGLPPHPAIPITGGA